VGLGEFIMGGLFVDNCRNFLFSGFVAQNSGDTIWTYLNLDENAANGTNQVDYSNWHDRTFSTFFTAYGALISIGAIHQPYRDRPYLQILLWNFDFPVGKSRFCPQVLPSSPCLSCNCDFSIL
jgi:hypothetical protein